MIDRLTQPRFFGFQFQQLPNGTVVLFLEDPNSVPPQPVETTRGRRGHPADDARHGDQPRVGGIGLPETGGVASATSTLTPWRSA